MVALLIAGVDEVLTSIMNDRQGAFMEIHTVPNVLFTTGGGALQSLRDHLSLEGLVVDVVV